MNTINMNNIYIYIYIYIYRKNESYLLQSKTLERGYMASKLHILGSLLALPTSMLGT